MLWLRLLRCESAAIPAGEGLAETDLSGEFPSVAKSRPVVHIVIDSLKAIKYEQVGMTDRIA